MMATIKLSKWWLQLILLGIFSSIESMLSAIIIVMSYQLTEIHICTSYTGALGMFLEMNGRKVWTYPKDNLEQ